MSCTVRSPCLAIVGNLRMLVEGHEATVRPLLTLSVGLSSSLGCLRVQRLDVIDHICTLDQIIPNLISAIIVSKVPQCLLSLGDLRSVKSF